MAFGLGEIVSGIFGSSDAGKEAAQLMANEARKAREEIARQFDETRQTLTPFIDAGTGQIGQVEASTTPEGLGEMLGRIFNTDALQPLIDERTRAVQGQLSAGGLTRSGTGLREIANVPTELGLALEQMFSNRSSNLMNTGLNAAGSLGQFGANQAAQQAQTFMDTGGAMAQGSLFDNAARNRRLQAFGELGGQFLTAGAQQFGQQAGGGSPGSPRDTPLGSAANAGFMATLLQGLSDPRLKTNVTHIGEIGGLNVYGWDWIDGVKETIIGKLRRTGFMADEVKEVYPDYVFEVSGFDTINYPALLNKLEAEHG